MSTTIAAPTRRYPGRLLLLLGLGLSVVGIIGYVVQVSLHHLWTPWYMPALATVGVLSLVASLWYARTVWRILALLLVLVLAGFQWMFLLETRLPDYTGPVASGQPFPEFATIQADGKPFTQDDLKGDQNNVMVFFRGRW